MKSDRSQTPGERPQGPATGTAPRPDPIPKSSAGAAPSKPATDCDPVAAALHAVPAGDADWAARDGHDNYILALQVIGGKVPHPGRP